MLKHIKSMPRPNKPILRPVRPIQLDQWRPLVSMIVHHIQNHRHTPQMRRIHQRLKGLRRAVILVQRAVHHRIVPPAQIPVKLRHRHQLNRIHPKSLQIIEAVLQDLKAALLQKIPQQQLVNHQILHGRSLKIRNLPRIRCFPGRYHTH